MKPSIVKSPNLPFYYHEPVPVISISLAECSRLTLYKQVKSPPQLLSILKMTIPTSIPNSMMAGGIGKVWVGFSADGSYCTVARRRWSGDGGMDVDLRSAVARRETYDLSAWSVARYSDTLSLLA